MAVIEDSLKQQAKELWLKGKKYKEISDITGIKESSIKSLASRYWNKEKLQPNKKKVAVAKKVATKNNAPPIKELTKEEIETLANEDLTEKQRLFCLHYTKWFNATKAYQKAYDCDYNTAMVNGCKLLSNTKIKEHIQAIKDAKIKQSMYNAEDYFQKMIEIAYADITDFMEFGKEDAETINGGFIKVNRAWFKDSNEVDGTLIQEVKQGKDGASIKLVSKEFALKWLDKNIGMASEEQRARIDMLKAQTKKLEKDDDIPDDSAQESMDAVSGIISQMQPIGDDEV